MRRFNNLLRESGLLQWSLKFIVVLVWVIWVAHVPALVAKVHEHQSKSSHRELTREEQFQSFNFTSAKATAARKLGNSYSPDHYYRDLRDIWRKYGPITDSNITVMQTYMHNNLQRFKGDGWGQYTAEDFERS